MISLPSLLPEKQDTLNKINQYFSTDNRIGYVHAPTGWGKTLLSKHIIKYCIQQKRSVLFVVSQNNQLLKQTAYKTNGKLLFPDSIVLSSDENGNGNGNDTLKETLKRVCSNPPWLIFASLQTLLSKNNAILKLSIAQAVDFVIVDEIHNFIQNKGNEFINSITQNAKILGLTATPYQGLLGNMKYVEDITHDIEEIHREKLLDCINKGILARLNYTIVRSNQSIMDVFSFKRGIIELTKQELSTDLINIKNLTSVLIRMQIAKTICQRIHHNSDTAKILIFCSPTQKAKDNKVVSLHAKLCAAILNNESIKSLASAFSNYDKDGQLKPAVYLSSDLPAKEKKDILQAFKTVDKPPYILCTVSMLVEGFDFPDLENLVLLRPTLSMRLFEQQIGRILRPGVLKEKSWANVFEVIDEINCLYDTFGKEIFSNQLISGQIQLLSPLIKIENLLVSDNMELEGLNTECVKVKEIRQEKDSLVVDTLSLKELSLDTRLLHIKKLLSIIKMARYGSLGSEGGCLLDSISNLTIYTVEAIKKVLGLIKSIEKMKVMADKDTGLSWSCRKCKPKILLEAGQLLRLNLLSSLEKIEIDNSHKEVILKYLGYNGLTIMDYKNECVKMGLGMPIEAIRKQVEGFTFTNKKIERACRACFNRWLKFFIE